MAINIFIVFRILIGVLFVVSGFEKLIGPYQNFLYIVQSYDMLPAWGEEIAARTMPWIEFVSGVFMALGLRLTVALPAVMALLMAFIVVVGQALIRKLPIDECGCFGTLISFPLNVVIVLDSLLLVLTGILAGKRDDAQKFSLDGYLNE
ncbi:MAG: hypothetical protein A3C36_05695 [Omnitrophica WOR_2 bacterium RIFCSPHIGHO2_02_FULL_52_10]|nr:MAG: hypothetical protein A3C36_05695 [Omnitrophica WOR_2 bacterium RIFCSPHIGHO2_02_FULL_52_10]